MTDASELDDYRWLVGPQAAEWLHRLAEDSQPLVNQTSRLRRHFSPRRTHLLLQQVELRRRGQTKFADAAHMFFTPRGLEQATDQQVADYKAQRFPRRGRVADLCCGIGGDLLGLAGRGPVLGVDRDPLTALLAEANVRARALPDFEAGGVSVRLLDAVRMSVSDFAAWHLDPDRRPTGKRTTRVEFHEPGQTFIERLLATSGNAAIKLAPAAELPRGWSQEAELEWISRARRCRQLVAWFGALAHHHGRRRATILDGCISPGASVLRTVVGDGAPGPTPVAPVGRYLFDPDPAVLAADLVGTLAAEHGLAATGPRAAYLTGDHAIADPALGCFEVTDVVPLDLKRLKRLLRERRVGQLEIKKRGVPHKPEELRRRLHLRGDNAAVLLMAPIAGTPTAILAQRAS